MLAHLEAHLDILPHDTSLAAVIVTGTGTRAFCIGADIDAWGDLTPVEFTGFGCAMGTVFYRLVRLSIPGIAALNGYVMGDGLELEATSDVRVIAPHRWLALPESSIGVVLG